MVRVSGGTSRACFFIRNSGFGLVCELEYGISTFDSESFELELNGRAWDTAHGEPSEGTGASPSARAPSLEPDSSDEEAERLQLLGQQGR
jgi:hypothetical protein